MLKDNQMLDAWISIKTIPKLLFHWLPRNCLYVTLTCITTEHKCSAILRIRLLLCLNIYIQAIFTVFQYVLHMACDMVTIFKEYKSITGTLHENIKKIVKRRKMEAKNFQLMEK